MNQFIMDMKSDHPSQKTSKNYGESVLPPREYSYDYTNPGVLDLSRRRDSIETRKTPSPYNTSSFEDGSPSTGSYGSPTSSGHLAPNHQQRRTHTSSPTSHLQYRTAFPRTFTSTVAVCPVPIKRETPSPEEVTIYPNLIVPPVDKIPANSFIMQAAAIMNAKGQLLSPCNQTKDGTMAPVAHDTFDNPPAATTPVSVVSSTGPYPMVVGRDGKLSRPFKAYPRDPLSLSASFTATDAILDTHSAEKYSAFRKRMLEQIHAANGGQPTISNPKMRRLTARAQSEDRESLDNINSRLQVSTISGPSSPKMCQYYNHVGSDSNSVGSPSHSPTGNDNNNSSNSSSLNAGVIKDTAYFERRKKNNAAAKKSRDRRRIKEDEIAIRAAFLERENIELKFELAAARKQLQAMNGATVQN